MLSGFTCNKKSVTCAQSIGLISQWLFPISPEWLIRTWFLQTIDSVIQFDFSRWLSFAVRFDQDALNCLLKSKAFVTSMWRKARVTFFRLKWYRWDLSYYKNQWKVFFVEIWHRVGSPVLHIIHLGVNLTIILS